MRGEESRGRDRRQDRPTMPRRGSFRERRSPSATNGLGATSVVTCDARAAGSAEPPAEVSAAKKLRTIIPATKTDGATLRDCIEGYGRFPRPINYSLVTALGFDRGVYPSARGVVIRPSLPIVSTFETRRGSRGPLPGPSTCP